MSEQTPIAIPPPAYLEQVEQLVGVRFFADPQQAELARTNPGLLPAETLATYAGIYIAGLRLLVQARRKLGADPQLLTASNRREIHDTNATDIQRIRERLIQHAPHVDSRPAGSMPAPSLRKQLKIGALTYRNILIDNGIRLTALHVEKTPPLNVLYVEAADVSIVQNAAAAIPVISPDTDVRTVTIMASLNIYPELLDEALAAFGFQILPKRISTENGRMADCISKIAAKLVQVYISELENMNGLTPISEISEALGVSKDTIYGHMHRLGFTAVNRRVRSPQSSPPHRIHTLPDEHADTIVHELSIIVPDGCLTVEEYASLRGHDDGRVSGFLEKSNLGTVNVAYGARSITYLLPATIYKLDRLMNPYERSDGSWRTMRELRSEFGVSGPTIANHLSAFSGEACRKMLPRGDSQHGIPHYSPEFRVYLRSVIKVNDGLARTSMGELIARTGLSRHRLHTEFRNAGLQSTWLPRPSGDYDSFFLNDELQDILPKLPKLRVPYGHVDINTLVMLNPQTSRQMLLRRMRPYGHVGKYIAEQGPTSKGSNYYKTSDASDAGLKVPASAAFPAGERPFGRYGPRRPVSDVTTRKPIDIEVTLGDSAIDASALTPPKSRRDGAISVTSLLTETARDQSGRYLLGDAFQRLGSRVVGMMALRRAAITPTRGADKMHVLNKDELVKLTLAFKDMTEPGPGEKDIEELIALSGLSRRVIYHICHSGKGWPSRQLIGLGSRKMRRVYDEETSAAILAEAARVKQVQDKKAEATLQRYSTSHLTEPTEAQSRDISRRLAEIRGRMHDGPKDWRSLAAGNNSAQDELLRRHARPLNTLLEQIPDKLRPTLEEAIYFVTEFGGQLYAINGMPYVIGEAAALINYNFLPHQHRPSPRLRSWLNRYALAEQTRQTLAQVDTDLHSFDWSVLRKQLISQPLKGKFSNGMQKKATGIYIRFSELTDRKIILPHYNPAIVQHLVNVAEQRQYDAATPSAP